MQVRAGVAQELGRPPEAGLGHPAEHARRLQLLVAGHAGVDALGGERDVHVLAYLQPALGKRRHEQLARAADICGRRQHERLSRAGMAHDRRAGALQDRGVGQVLLVDGRRDADQDQVGGIERLDPVGQGEAVAREVIGQVATLGVQQLRHAATDRIQTPDRSVDPDDPTAGVAHRDRRRQADIAEAHDRDDGVRDARRCTRGCRDRWILR